MPIHMRLAYGMICAVTSGSLLGAPGQIRANHKKGQPPLKLEVESPTPGSIEYRSAYPLSFRMSPRNPHTPFGSTSSAQIYPQFEKESFLILKDLDDCPSLIFTDCPVIPGEELYLRFYPDIDSPGTPDFGGDFALRLALFIGEERPRFFYNGMTRTLGPGLPYTELDGVGYGANDDLPGFVLLSNVGPGIVLDAELGSDGHVTGFTRQIPERARNLAGLLTDVSVETRSGRNSRTVIRTSGLVPNFLFSTFRIIDPCVGGIPDELDCIDPQGEQLHRIDGGAMTESDIFQDEFSTDSNPESSNVSEVLLRAFVVDGVAPSLIDDCDFDGQVTAEDALCLGYTLLSNEVIVEFRQLGNHHLCGGLFFGPWNGEQGNAILVDFDGNGPPKALSCPTGGGRVTNPPM